LDHQNLESWQNIERLANRLVNAANKADSAGRYLLGIVGPPGSGKSTLALALVETVNHRLQEDLCVVVPMDGFHLPNSVLNQRGLRSLKGIPETFDAASFVRLLEQLKIIPRQIVSCPNFERAIDEPVEDAITISALQRIVIVEGNYLLLDTPPWNGIAKLLDESWYLSVERDVLKQRLLQRHIEGGKTRAQAEEKILSTDFPNAELIEKTRDYANLSIGSD